MVYLLREICCYLHHNLLLGITNEEVLSTTIKQISGAVAGDSEDRQKLVPNNVHTRQISGAVAGDSKLQDRGVAHYPLPLLFSLASLLYSFYLCLCVYIKNTKKMFTLFLLDSVTMGSYRSNTPCDYTSFNGELFWEDLFFAPLVLQLT